MLLHRYREFQTELVLMHPGTTWDGKEHRHPNVDSIEIELFGCANFTRNGKVIELPDFHYAGRNFVYLDHTDFHGIGDAPLPLGAALLSCQLWLNNVQPTSVGLDWEGEPTSKGHAHQLLQELE